MVSVREKIEELCAEEGDFCDVSRFLGRLSGILIEALEKHDTDILSLKGACNRIDKEVDSIDTRLDDSECDLRRVKREAL